MLCNSIRLIVIVIRANNLIQLLPPPPQPLCVQAAADMRVAASEASMHSREQIALQEHRLVLDDFVNLGGSWGPSRRCSPPQRQMC